MEITNLPTVAITPKLYLQQILKEGNMTNNYSPFKNLLENGKLSNFRTTNLPININLPLNIEIQGSFDGSVNLILNNDDITPRLINSRFSTQELNTYLIPDHKGNKDTNVYDDNTLSLDTSLYKNINKIPTLIFNGINKGGKMKCGSYHFYFKFSDNDNNETDFISESGVVVCHIGDINTPDDIRMGMVDEDSKKSVKFTLENLDTAYDFVKVYYTRTTSDNSQQDITEAFIIEDKYPIFTNFLDLTISGFETHSSIALAEINNLYELAGKVKTQTQCQNMLFFGNINKPTIDYKELEDLSLRFIPSVVSEDNIGNLNGEYKDIRDKNLVEYYDTKNIYYNLGYWPEELYRFGVVYLLNDFTLSPVFNTRGLDLSIANAVSSYIFEENDERIYINYDSDGYLINKTNTYENANGIIRLPKNQVIFEDKVKPLGIKFILQQGTIERLKTKTKGFFIVRQERIPTIYAQGITIGKTANEYGNLPVIKNEYGIYFTQSFLGEDSILNKTEVKYLPNVVNKALIVPEAAIRSPLFSQIFTSSEFKLTCAKEQTYISANRINDNVFIRRGNLSGPNSSIISKLTQVNSGIDLTTNGVDYFSAKAGNAEQIWDYKNVTISLDNTQPNIGKHINLTDSISYVRGEYGTYVGMSDGSSEFGTIFNVREKDYDENNVSYITGLFKIRMENSSPYMAISDRISWDKVTDINKITTVYRGDCYICNYTHRINRNFIDPDFPTNHKIVDKKTWKNNFIIWSDGVVNIDNTAKGLNRQLITYKQKGSDPIIEPSDATYANAGSGLFDAFAKGDMKIKGCDKINRGDVNAVPLGHWVTFKVMSNINRYRL